jgi:phospholipase/carboxylesterase
MTKLITMSKIDLMCLTLIFKKKRYFSRIKSNIVFKEKLMYQMEKQENAVLLKPKEPPSHAMIWLHGLGANGYDFVEVMSRIDFPENCQVLGVFPHAPEQEVTLNQGAKMPAWYDIRSFDFMNDVDAAGIRVSTYIVYQWLDDLVKQGIPAKNIILAGFSQGGVIALHAGLTAEHNLGGILAMSTYCPMAQQFYMHRDVPIWMAHGTEDAVIPFSVAEASKQSLQAGGYHIDWHTYQMGHHLCEDEIDAIRQWCQQRFSE